MTVVPADRAHSPVDRYAEDVMRSVALVPGVSELAATCAVRGKHLTLFDFLHDFVVRWVVVG